MHDRVSPECMRLPGGPAAGLFCRGLHAWFAFLVLGLLGLMGAGGAGAAQARAMDDLSHRDPRALAYDGPEGEWADIFGRPGVDGPVYAVAQHDNLLILGGAFRRAGHIDAPYLVGWDGSAWLALGDPGWGPGEGISDVAINAIHMLGPLLVVGGRIVGGGMHDVVASWDGVSWSDLGDLGDPAVSTVKALTIFEGNLIAGGYIPPKRYVAAYAEGIWSTLGGGMNGEVLALALFGDDLVAAGKFTEADDKAANHVAAWNGSSWRALGAGLGGTVYALAVYENHLVAAGDFPGFVAVWNGTSWSGVSSVIPGIVRSLGISRAEGADSLLYGGGGSQTSGFLVRNRNGSPLDWDVVTLELDSAVRAVGACPGDSVIYLGGEFSRIDTLDAFHVAELDADRFFHLGQSGYGLDSDVEVLGIYGDDLIAATWPASVLAWDGSAWHVLAANADDHIDAVVSHAGNLVVAGAFTQVAGQSLSHIASWNGTSWSPLAAGLNGAVYDLAVYNGNLVAGGSFSQAGGVAASNLAMWNGSAWSEVGGGRGHPVDQVAVWDGKLVVSVRNSIQTWNGTFWRLLGTTYGTVRCLEVHGQELLAAGDFYDIGGVSARRIALWDGTSWSPLGAGLEGDTGWPDYWGGVLDLAVYNGNPVAGGYFDSPCYNIARWDGFAWECLGVVDSSVHALTVWDGSLVGGGPFETAGGLTSYRIAVWDDFVDPPGSLAAVGLDEAVSLAWENPSDPAFQGTVLRYSLDGLPEDPTQGLPVPNGNEGRFEGEPGSESSFVHTGLPSDVTYYYSAFSYDGLGHYSSGLFASATTLDKNPPDTMPDFTVTPGSDYLQLRWTNPPTEDFLGTLIRYSTVGYPVHPDSGLPVPNGAGGRFEGLPGSQGSFIHTGVEVARTYYYSAFAYDQDLNHSAPVGARGLVADVFPPELDLEIFQNPYLTQYLDIYLLSSEPVDPSSAYIKPGGDSIGVVSVNGMKDLWLGQYELTGPGGKITINACASDTSGNFICEADTFSTGLILRTGGGAVESADGRLKLVVPAGGMARDAYVTVRSYRERPGFWPAERLGGNLAFIGRAGWEEACGPAYTLMPAGILKGSGACIEIAYDGNAAATGIPPDAYCIEQAGRGLLTSYVDPKSRTVTAEVSSLGTFRLAVGKPGVSELVDPEFLGFAACRPNPFGGETTITFRIRAWQQVRLSVYDAEGRLVDRIMDRRLPPGTHSARWTARPGGRDLPSGVYFLRIATEHNHATAKLALIH
jgi:hypothetical protein